MGNIEELFKVVKMRKQASVFLRFGYWSRAECSMNFSTGVYEKGLSVYPTMILPGNKVAIDWSWRVEVDAHCLSIPDFANRAIFALTGKVIDEGNDYEPVLQLSSIVVRGFLAKIGDKVHKSGVDIVAPDYHNLSSKKYGIS